MRWLVAPAMLFLVSSARADVGVRVVDALNGVLDGGVWSAHDGGIANATVRVVGERAIFVVHTNAYGQFSISGLSPGIYRIETDRGHLIDLIHGPVEITKSYPVCDLGRSFGGSFESVIGSAIPPAPLALTTPHASSARTTLRGHVDTTSTSQGIAIDSASLRSLP
jgi:hypothetical protein